MTGLLSSVGVLHVLPDPPGPVRPADDGVRAGPARAAADPGGARLGRVSPEERERTAYHESGHALLGMLTRAPNPVRKISVIPTGRPSASPTRPPDRPVRLLHRLPARPAQLPASRARRDATSEGTSGSSSRLSVAPRSVWQATNAPSRSARSSPARPGCRPPQLPEVAIAVLATGSPMIRGLVASPARPRPLSQRPPPGPPAGVSHHPPAGPWRLPRLAPWPPSS